MSDESNDHSFARSQADLMAGVAGVFFVLMAVYFVKVVEKTNEQLAMLEAQDRGEAHAEAAVASSLRELKNELEALRDELTSSGANILVELDENAQLLKVNLDPSGTVFDYKAGTDQLECTHVDAAVRALHETIRVVCSNIYRKASGNDREVQIVHRIVLEGHTDNSPISEDRYPLNSCPGTAAEKNAPSRAYAREFGANVALSGRRAVNVVRLATESKGLSDAEKQCVENFLLVSGRGPVEPISVGGTPPAADTPWRSPQLADVDKPKNRRVVLFIEGRQDIKRLAQQLRGEVTGARGH